MLLPRKKFIYHYKNVRWARGRHETYLCFVVKRRVGPDTLTFDFGHLRNRSGCHVEVSHVGQDREHYGRGLKWERQKITILSIEWFYPSYFAPLLSLQLLFLRYLGALCPGLWGYGGTGERKVSYSITWFCSWSPCANCSTRLCQFLNQTPNLRLRIFVSRLYFCDMEDSLEREGLRKLKKAGVHITVMSYKGGGLNLFIWGRDIIKI